MLSLVEEQWTILKYRKTMFSMAIMYSPILLLLLLADSDEAWESMTTDVILRQTRLKATLLVFHVKRAFKAVEFPRNMKGTKGVNRP
jgi:hypothetical protein